MSFIDRMINIGVDEKLHPSDAMRVRLINMFCAISMLFLIICFVVYFQSVKLVSVFGISFLVFGTVVVLNYRRKYLIGKVLMLNYVILVIVVLCLLAGGSGETPAMLLLPISLAAMLFSAKNHFWRLQGYVLPIIFFITLEYNDYSWLEEVNTTGIAKEVSTYLPFLFTALLLVIVLNYFVRTSDSNEKEVAKLLDETSLQNSKLQLMMDEFIHNQEELYSMNKQLEEYKENLELKVKERTRQLRIEKARLDYTKTELEELHESEKQQREQLEGVLKQLQNKEQQLTKAYEELQASARDLRMNAEELKTTNEDLENTKITLEFALKKESEIRVKLEKTLFELKDAQAKLVQSEKMASLGQITAGVAHEINNPINFVLAGSDVLADSLSELMSLTRLYREIKSSLNSNELISKLKEVEQLCDKLQIDHIEEDIYQTVADIKEGAVRTAEIVKGLRNFSRMDEDALKKANVHDGLDSTLVILRNQYKNRVEIIKDYDPSVIEIDCYPGKLNQVFMNILGNAIDAIEGEGRVWITTKDLGEQIGITIQDTGSGIPEEIAQKVFDPFFTTKEVGKGTGLGLAIVYGIIEKHQGEISFESTPNQGTVFTIKLQKHLSKKDIRP